MALFGRKKTPQTVEVPAAQPRVLAGAPEPREDGLRSLEEHVEFLCAKIEPLPAFGMGLLDGTGLTLCEDLRAYQDMPPADLARVVGVAVRAADVAHATHAAPARLFLAAELEEGDVAEGELCPGECVRVARGAIMPEGADAVVDFGSCRLHDGDVDVTVPVAAGENVRPQASIVSDGEMLLRKGAELNPRTAGQLAAAGIDRIIARPRPRVVVLAAGADLLEASARMGKDSDLYDTSSYLISSAVKDDQAQVWRVPVHTADPNVLRDAINDQLIRADLLILTTGSAREDAEMVAELLPLMGDTDIANVAFEPARTQYFTLLGEDRVPLVWLSGTPMEAYTSYVATVRPLIRTLMDKEPRVQRPVRAVATSVVRSTLGKTSHVPAILHEDGSRRVVDPLQDTDGSQLAELAAATHFIVLGEDQGTVVAGDQVRVIRLDEE